MGQKKEILEEVATSVIEGISASNWIMIESFHKAGRKLVSLGGLSKYDLAYLENEVQRPMDFYVKLMIFYKTYPSLDGFDKGITWYKIERTLPLPDYIKKSLTLWDLLLYIKLNVNEHPDFVEILNWVDKIDSKILSKMDKYMAKKQQER